MRNLHLAHDKSDIALFYVAFCATISDLFSLEVGGENRQRGLAFIGILSQDFIAPASRWGFFLAIVISPIVTLANHT